MVHIDSGTMVLNLHLSAGFNDTSTTFWALPLDTHKQHHTKRALTVGCKSNFTKLEVDAMQSALRRQVDFVTRHYKGRPLSEHNYSAFADETDPMEIFSFVDKIAYRQNRLVLYSGHMFHAGGISPEAGRRLRQEPSVGRLMLQHFIGTPALQELRLKCEEQGIQLSTS